VIGCNLKEKQKQPPMKASTMETWGGGDDDI
jgi:hypothetical protein